MVAFGWILVILLFVILGACTLAPFALSGRIAEQEERSDEACPAAAELAARTADLDEPTEVVVEALR